MPAFSFEIKGLAEMQRAFLQAPAIVKAEFNRAIHGAIPTLTRYSILNFHYFPLKSHYKRTGNLMGVGKGLQESYGELVGQLNERMPYGIYVHEGTYKMTARPFFQLAITEGQSTVNRFFDTMLQNITNQLSK